MVVRAIRWSFESQNPRELGTFKAPRSLYAIGIHIRHTTFSLIYHFQQCPWDIGSATAERSGQKEYPKGANSMVASGLSCRKSLVGTG